MKERNPNMDHYSDLTENQKSFLDDLYDDQILNICRRSIRPGAYQFEPSVLMNKHGKSMEFKEMGEVKRYCLWLWEVGAVKYAKNNPVLSGSDPAS